MTAEEYIKSELLGFTTKTEPYYFRFDLQQLIRVMQNFTKINCKEQKQKCAEEFRQMQDTALSLIEVYGKEEAAKEIELISQIILETKEPEM